MTVACQKRGVPVERLREAVGRVERDLFREADAEVPTTKVGEAVLRELRGIDPVAFVRFASVYRPFSDIESLKEALAALEEGRVASMEERSLQLALPGAEEGEAPAPVRLETKKRAAAIRERARAAR